MDSPFAGISWEGAVVVEFILWFLDGLRGAWTAGEAAPSTTVDRPPF